MRTWSRSYNTIRVDGRHVFIADSDQENWQASADFVVAACNQKEISDAATSPDDETEKTRCTYCGKPIEDHHGICDTISAIELNDNGTWKRVEFFMPDASTRVDDFFPLFRDYTTCADCPTEIECKTFNGCISSFNNIVVKGDFFITCSDCKTPAECLRGAACAKASQ